jgi:hypothetical protein
MLALHNIRVYLTQYLAPSGVGFVQPSSRSPRSLILNHTLGSGDLLDLRLGGAILILHDAETVMNIFIDAESAPSLAFGRGCTPFRNVIATNSPQVSTFEEMRKE